MRVSNDFPNVDGDAYIRKLYLLTFASFFVVASALERGCFEYGKGCVVVIMPVLKEYTNCD